MKNLIVECFVKARFCFLFAKAIALNVHIMQDRRYLLYLDFGKLQLETKGNKYKSLI